MSRQRWGYIYRDDVGAYNLDGSVVEFGDLHSIFVRDMVVGLDVNLAYMRADENKRCILSCHALNAGDQPTWHTFGISSVHTTP